MAPDQPPDLHTQPVDSALPQTRRYVHPWSLQGLVADPHRQHGSGGRHDGGRRHLCGELLQFTQLPVQLLDKQYDGAWAG
jgi:hypothetical protein